MIAVSRLLGSPRLNGVGDKARQTCRAIAEQEWSGQKDDAAANRTAPAPIDIACVQQLQIDFTTAAEQLKAGLLAIQTGARPDRAVSLPVHRNMEVALCDALRITIAFGASALFYVASGWPATSVALSLVATLCALSATSPSQEKFATGALVALPIAVVYVAVVRFAVLDGSQGFAGLVLVLIPFTLLSGYLTLQPMTAGIGALLNVFTPTLLAPSNPQSYDLQTFLTICVLICSSVTILILTSRLVLPVTPSNRLAWALRAARRDLADAIRGRQRSPGQQRARSDDQIAQVGA